MIWFGSLIVPIVRGPHNVPPLSRELRDRFELPNARVARRLQRAVKVRRQRCDSDLAIRAIV